MSYRRPGARFSRRGVFGRSVPTEPPEPWVVPGFGSTLVLDLLADNYEPGETGDALAVRDLSGNGNDAQQVVTAFQPTPTAGAIDGKLAITHTGTAQDHMFIPGLATFMNGANRVFAIGIYLRPLLLDSNGAVMTWIATGNDTNYVMLQAPQHNSAKWQATRRGSGGIDGGTSVNDISADARTLYYSFDGTTGRLWENGVELSLSDAEHAAGTTTCNTCIIGSWFTGGALSRMWSGDWRRINLWSAVPSDAERDNWHANVRSN